jgi:rhodanese-related sulfurtransferase
MKFNRTTGKNVMLTALLIILTSILSAQIAEMSRLSAIDFRKKIENLTAGTEEYVLLDIRTKAEYDQGHIKDASMLDFYSPGFIDELKKLDKKTTYLIYCRSGNRTGQTLQIMQKLGFENVYDLENGIKSWLGAGYLLEK